MISNVDASKNVFHFDEGQTIVVAVGYKVQDTAKYIDQILALLVQNNEAKKQYFLQLKTNNSTLPTSIRATFPIISTKCISRTTWKFEGKLDRD